MPLDREKTNIYFLSAVIAGALLFMGGSMYLISNSVEGASSYELQIDREVEACYERVENSKQ